MGDVGERRGKRMGIPSGGQPPPGKHLSGIIILQSGAGELPAHRAYRVSYACGGGRARLPPHPAQPRLHGGRTAVKLKLVIVRSGREGTQADYSIRTPQSRQVYKQAVAEKDPVTGLTPIPANRLLRGRLRSWRPRRATVSTRKNATRCFEIYHVSRRRRPPALRVPAPQARRGLPHCERGRLRRGDADMQRRHHNGGETAGSRCLVFNRLKPYINFPRPGCAPAATTSASSPTWTPWHLLLHQHSR